MAWHTYLYRFLAYKRTEIGMYSWHGNVIYTSRASMNPIQQHYRLSRPCPNCPFRKEGGVSLQPGRLAGIVDGLLKDDMSTFQCHKTVHSRHGGQWSEEGDYQPSGRESMCAGAAAYLMKQGRPTVGMRLAMATGAIRPHHWAEAEPVTIDAVEDHE